MWEVLSLCLLFFSTVVPLKKLYKVYLFWWRGNWFLGKWESVNEVIQYLLHDKDKINAQLIY